MRPFLLMAWYRKSTRTGSHTWINTFSSREEAEQVVVKVPAGTYDRQDYDGYLLKDYYLGIIYEGYEIVDLREWMDK